MKLILRLFGIVCIAAGLSHVLLGLQADNFLGAKLPLEVVSNASLDSQNRFYGAAFMLFGGAAWICADDLKLNARLFRAMMAIFFLGGLARLFSTINYGMPATLVQVLALTELVIPPILLWWHSRLIRTQMEQNGDQASVDAL
jgi:hypothetical protein